MLTDKERIAMLEARLAALETRMVNMEASHVKYGPIVQQQPFMPQPTLPWTVTCDAGKVTPNG